LSLWHETQTNRLCLIWRTAVYGPVCTVVWEGRSRETPPYPDTAVNRIGRAGMLAPDRQKRPGEPGRLMSR